MLRIKNWAKRELWKGWKPLILIELSEKASLKEVTFEQRPKGDKEKLMCISEVVEKDKCIGPRAGVCLAYLRESEGASVANTD